LPEYAFVGRSNVGKSSLINMLMGKKNLAKTSNTPGKTKLINHFLINDEWYLVDLPGMGYAKVSHKERKSWQSYISEYLWARKNLMNTFMLVDLRIAPQAIDLEFMQLLGTREIPFTIVFTKSDKLTKNELNRNLSHYQRILAEGWEALPPIVVTSSETRLGREEILKLIAEMNTIFDPAKMK
jgi:GTP-binding protein